MFLLLVLWVSRVVRVSRSGGSLLILLVAARARSKVPAVLSMPPENPAASLVRVRRTLPK